MYQILCIMFAPSISAASYIEVSIPVMVAIYTTEPYPRPFHTSKTTIINGQYFGSVYTFTGLSDIDFKTVFKIP